MRNPSIALDAYAASLMAVQSLSRQGKRCKFRFKLCTPGVKLIIQLLVAFLVCRLHRDLAWLDPAPFRYIDSGAEINVIPEGHIGPIPGNYHLIAGRLPVAEATNAQVKAQARQAVAGVEPLPPFVAAALLQHGSGRGELAHSVRAFCQGMWPVIYQVACLLQEDALAAWRLPKERVVTLLPADQAIGRRARAFDTAMRRYYPTQASIEAALAVIAAGVRFLEAVAAWVMPGGHT